MKRRDEEVFGTDVALWNYEEEAGKNMTSPFITMVGSDRTIILPPDIPVGATIAVVVIPSEALKDQDAARQARFEATLAAIRAASASSAVEPPISDDELTALVERARKTRSA